MSEPHRRSDNILGEAEAMSPWEAAQATARDVLDEAFGEYAEAVRQGHKAKLTEAIERALARALISAWMREPEATDQIDLHRTHTSRQSDVPHAPAGPEEPLGPDQGSVAPEGDTLPYPRLSGAEEAHVPVGPEDRESRRESSFAAAVARAMGER
jgi:hypothetical protein